MSANIQVGRIIPADEDLIVDDDDESILTTDDGQMPIELELTKPILVNGVKRSSLILHPPRRSDIKTLVKMSRRIVTGPRQWLIYFAKYSDASFAELGQLHVRDARRFRKIAIEQIKSVIPN